MHTRFSARSDVRRLQTRAQFQATLAGPIVARSAHFALHRQSVPVAAAPAARQRAQQRGWAEPVLLAGDAVWLGALVPKRWARRAVTRSAIRRQIYAIGHDQAEALPCAAYVIRLRATFDRKRFVSAWSEPLRLVVRAELQQLLSAPSLIAPAVPAPANFSPAKP